MNAGLVGSTLGIDYDRQVAADAQRIHIVEKDRALCTQKVLDVMLRGHQQDIYASILHEPVELRSIESGSRSFRRKLGALVHNDYPYDQIRLNPRRDRFEFACVSGTPRAVWTFQPTMRL